MKESAAAAIWFEATAIVPDGRSGPTQLLMARHTLTALAGLVEATREAARSALGADHRPLLVLQLPHSGRYSYRDAGSPRRVACANPHLDPRVRRQMLFDQMLPPTSWPF